MTISLRVALLFLLGGAAVSAGESAAVLLVYGNVYPDGVFFVELRIGDPPKPYFLDVDTGSDLSWIQCDAPCISCAKGPHPLYKPTRDKLLPCGDPLCGGFFAEERACKSPEEQCDYEVEYADRGFSRGVLVRDVFSIPFANGSLLRPRIAFGCGYEQELQGKSAPTDGVLGLGSGGAGALAQLSAQGLARNVVGHCLSRSGGGFLFFGGDLFPATGFSWVDASSRGHYSPGKADLFLGTKLFSKRQPIVLDTGSSYTYLSSRPYSSFLRLLEEGLAVAPLEEAAGDGALPLCWRGKRPFKSLDEAAKFFKPLTLVFFKKVLLEIPPRGYLVLSKLGNVCLGILNGTHVGLNDYNIIGDISMLDLLVVYDNEKKRIGWARADCSRLLNVNGDDGFDSGSIWSMLQSRDGFTHRLLNRL
ncbi:eukaryotic aspartyl protease family protein isoform X2 [Wolffia australiana]